MTVSRSTPAGAAYNDLRNKAKRDERSVLELQTLYALEGFLARLSASKHRDAFVLKGGVLLAAFGDRRPTRDIDLAMRDLDSDKDNVLKHVCEIAATVQDDGLVFDSGNAAARIIRDEAEYNGVRVSMAAQLATAKIPFHVDVSVGDPIFPGAQPIDVPRLLEAERSIALRGYPMEMVYAEKLSTAVSLATVNTRMRDYGDIYTLSRRHDMAADTVITALVGVAAHRKIELALLATVLDGFAAQRQSMWANYRRDYDRTELPASFPDVLAAVIAFADPVISQDAAGRTWRAATQSWGAAAPDLSSRSLD